MKLLIVSFMFLYFPYSQSQSPEDQVLSTQCRIKWNTSGDLCLFRAQAFCARRPNESLCRAYAVVKAQNNQRGRSYDRQFDQIGDRNRNSGRHVQQPRDCTGQRGNSRERCEALNQCRLMPNKEERQKCKRSVKCNKHTGQKREDCLSKKSCRDLEDTVDQANCRAEKYCAKKRGTERTQCESVAKMDCESNTSGKVEQCLRGRLCGYLQGQEQKDCEDEAQGRCGKIADPDDQADCYEERRPKIASKEQLDSLRAAMNQKVTQSSMLNSPKVMGFRPQIAQLNPQATAQHSEQSVNARSGTDLFGGDMALTSTQLADIQADLTRNGRKKRKVGRAPTYKLWDDNPIPFQFDSSVPASTRQNIRESIRLWEKNTCVRWQENGQGSDKLEFYNGGGCSSFVGRTGGLQPISIATPECDFMGIISHEIGHSLGLIHEQSRPDQDRNVNVVYANINSVKWSNFLPSERHEVNDYNLPYDYGSVMHYDGTAFANDNKQLTILTIDPLAQQSIGQRKGPSFVDFAQINAAYCANKCSRQLFCQHGGYTDPNNCNRCTCPSGFGGNLCQNRQPASCGADLVASQNSQTIQSPNYPNQFGLNQECVWKIRTETGFTITLRFEGAFEFNCKSSCDENHVELKLGGDWRKTGYRFCCSERPANEFVSKDNEMVVIFRNNGGRAKRGFSATITTNAPESPNQITATTSLSITTQQPRTTRTTTSRTRRTVAPWFTDRPHRPPPHHVTPDHDGCRCSPWTEWSTECSHDCGGCGRIRRRRFCHKREKKEDDRHRSECQVKGSRPCAGNQYRKPCPTTTAGGLQWTKEEYEGHSQLHLLTKGCCWLAPYQPSGVCGTGKFNWLYGMTPEPPLPPLDTGDGQQNDSELRNLFGG